MLPVQSWGWHGTLVLYDNVIYQTNAETAHVQFFC